MEKIVLLSSAVADADNQVSTSGKKLELLLSMIESIGVLSRAEIQPAQKKIEDLALRIIFQICPAVIVPAIVSLLNSMYIRGSSAGMHACVAFLLQLAANDLAKPDRPLPFDPDEHGPTISVAERATCLAVAAGILELRGPSAGYFVPNFVAVVSKHVRFTEPAPRAESLLNLARVITSVGLPPLLLPDVWKNVIQKPLIMDRSHPVRVAAATCAAALCASGSPSSLSPVADQIQAVAIKQEHALLPPLLTVYASQLLPSSEEIVAKHGSIKSTVTNLGTLLSWILGTVKKHKDDIHLFTILSEMNFQPFLKNSEDLYFLGIFFVKHFSQVAAVRRIITTYCVGDGSILGFARAVLVPMISSNSALVALSGLTDCIQTVEGSVVALDGFTDSLIALLIETRSIEVAKAASFTLRVFAHFVPSQAFSLVNILFNHLRIELVNKHSITILSHVSVALSSVMCECVSMPEDVVEAIIATATDLATTDEDEMWQKRSCGCILLLPLVGKTPVLNLLAIWKANLGKQSKDSTDLKNSDHFETILNALRLLKLYLTIESASEINKLVLVLLNNVWQIVQQNPHPSIRSELFQALLAMKLEDFDSLHKPLIVYLSTGSASMAGISLNQLIALADAADPIEDRLHEEEHEEEMRLHETNLIPYAPWIVASHSIILQPVAVECQVGAIDLLAKLLSVSDNPETCINVLLAEFRLNENWIDEKGNFDFEKIGNIIIFFLTLIKAPNCISPAVLTVIAVNSLSSPNWLIRRLAAKVVAKSRDAENIVAQCALSTSPVIRSSGALIIGYAANSSSVLLFFPTLIKLARELTSPLRAAALWALHAGCIAGQTSVAPWVRDILRIALAHTVADTYPASPVIRLLLARLLTGIVAASFSLSKAELARTDLIWQVVKSDSSPLVVSASLAYASRVDPTSVSHGMYVLENIVPGSGLAAIEGFTEMTEQGLILPSVDFNIYAKLFVLCDQDRKLRQPVNRLLKVLLRASAGAAMPLVLAAMQTVVADEPDDQDIVDEDDYGEQRVSRVRAAPVAVLTLPTRALAVKCLNRILKSSSPNIRFLDQLVQIAASADDSSELLQIECMKLLHQIVLQYNSPALLQFEAQILTPVRRAIRPSSDACCLVQELALEIALKMVYMSPKLIELLVAPIGSTDPALLTGWPTYFSLRPHTGGRQSHEHELTRLLYVRMRVIVELLPLVDPLWGPAIHYYLLRLLADASEHPALVPFSVLAGHAIPDLALLRGVVVRGLALSRNLQYGKIAAPSDCPLPLDFEALYVAAAMDAPTSITPEAALLIAFDLGYSEVLNGALAPSNWLADNLVATHPEWAEGNLDRIWGFLEPGVESVTVIRWLAGRKFFLSKSSKLCDLVYSQMLVDPVKALALWRDVITGSEEALLSELCGETERQIRFVMVMLVTLMAAHTGWPLEILDQVRSYLLNAFPKDPQSVNQAVSKLVALPDISVSFGLPLVLELLTLDPDTALLQLIANQIDIQTVEYEQLVGFILTTAQDADIVVQCMHRSPDVFKKCLPMADKTRIETLVRGQVKKTVEEAPQIHLKLKFGSK